MADSSAIRNLTLASREEAVILFGPRTSPLRSECTNCSASR